MYGLQQEFRFVAEALFDGIKEGKIRPATRNYLLKIR